MAYLGYAYVAFMLGMGFFLAYKTSDTFRTFVERIKGKKIIYIEGVSSAIKGDHWKSYVEESPFGQKIAFRYPSSRIGKIVLNDDGTADYCGAVRWKEI